MSCRAFTLVEVMVAVLLLALLASAATLSFSAPLNAARAQDSLDAIAAFDADARRAAIASGSTVRVEFDLGANRLARFEGDGSPRAIVHLPNGFRIDQVRVDGRTTSTGVAPIEVAAHGWSRTYAARVVGPGLDRWLCFAGLTGARSEVTDERSLPAAPPMPRQTPGDDAD